jgi:hypothetical protein
VAVIGDVDATGEQYVIADGDLVNAADVAVVVDADAITDRDAGCELLIQMTIKGFDAQSGEDVKAGANVDEAAPEDSPR